MTQENIFDAAFEYYSTLEESFNQEEIENI
jgi:hypothetical protein